MDIHSQYQKEESGSYYLELPLPISSERYTENRSAMQDFLADLWEEHRYHAEFPLTELGVFYIPGHMNHLTAELQPWHFWRKLKGANLSGFSLSNWHLTSEIEYKEPFRNPVDPRAILGVCFLLDAPSATELSPETMGALLPYRVYRKEADYCLPHRGRIVTQFGHMIEIPVGNIFKIEAAYKTPLRK